LKGTIEHKIVFNRGNVFSIFGFIDLDCAKDQHGCWSTFGHVFQLDNTCTMWSSWKLPMITFSSIEAKRKSLAESTKKSIYLQNLIEQFKLPTTPSLTLFYDKHNIKIVKNLMMMHVRTKHIELHYHFIKEHVQSKWNWASTSLQESSINKYHD
jgi:hypothetical protein